MMAWDADGRPMKGRRYEQMPDRPSLVAPDRLSDSDSSPAFTISGELGALRERSPLTLGSFRCCRERNTPDQFEHRVEWFDREWQRSLLRNDDCRSHQDREREERSGFQIHGFVGLGERVSNYGWSGTRLSESPGSTRPIGNGAALLGDLLSTRSTLPSLSRNKTVGLDRNSSAEASARSGSRSANC